MYGEGYTKVELIEKALKLGLKVDNSWKKKDVINAINAKLMNPHVFPLGGVGMIPNQNGMLLRDYFAAKAMQSLIDKPVLISDFSVYSAIINLANQSYMVADAMLKERNKKQ